MLDAAGFPPERQRRDPGGPEREGIVQGVVLMPAWRLPVIAHPRFDQALLNTGIVAGIEPKSGRFEVRGPSVPEQRPH